MAKIKIGIIGCGTIANSAHIPAYMANPDVEIKYFCDILPEKAKAAVEKYGCGIAVEDYHDIIADPEVEAVSVCTPNKMHSIISVDCLRGGKHVLCEKPAARTYADALEMQKAQHETGKVLNIGVVNRFNTAVNKLRELIQRGDFGEIYHVYGFLPRAALDPGSGRRVHDQGHQRRRRADRLGRALPRHRDVLHRRPAAQDRFGQGVFQARRRYAQLCL